MVEWFGYQGHFCCNCDFHLTTLVSNGTKNILISTVGRLPNYLGDIRYQQVGAGRWFETEVYEAKKVNSFWEADVRKNLESKAYGFKDDASLEEINQFEHDADIGHKQLVEKYRNLLGV